MTTKQSLVTLGVLVVAAGVVGFLVSRTQPVAPAPAAPVAASEYVDEGPYLLVKVEYPEAPQAVRTTIEAGIQALAAEFKSNAKVDELTPEDVEFMGLGPNRKYTFEASVESYTSPLYTSYLYNLYEDTLGAHPNASYKTFVFDQGSREVRLSQLFANNPNWLEELSLLVSNDVSAQYRSRTGSSDLTGLLYPEGLAPREENFKNFVVDGNTLVVFIPPYQVAAYAVGSFEVRIPLTDLQ